MRAEEPGPPRRSRFFVAVPDNRFAISGMTIQGVQPPSVTCLGPLTRNTE
jgi:hypothetical protein